jgi:hypothetical protein
MSRTPTVARFAASFTAARRGSLEQEETDG